MVQTVKAELKYKKKMAPKQKSMPDHIKDKKKVLREFGIRGDVIEAIFSGRNFRSLQALDNFSDALIKMSFQEESLLEDPEEALKLVSERESAKLAM